MSGQPIADQGGNKALQLCLEASDDDASASAPPLAGDAGDLAGWSQRFLQACARLAEAEQVLAHCERGFMLLVDDHGTFDAWIATKRLPTSWHERADVGWWAAWLAQRIKAEQAAVVLDRRSDKHDGPEHDASYRQAASVQLRAMAYQIGYPPDATIGGCSIQTYQDVLAWLVARALKTRDRGESVEPHSEATLIAAIASDLDQEPAIAARALDAFTLDRENAAYHAAVPGIAAAPLVRIGPDQIVLSAYGLTTQPLFFLTRELRRRAGPEYHNAAILRERVFRHDLYTLFEDRRFVKSPGRIELRREAGDVRTDIDCAVFDRKSGTLALFELKSQDPFARSTAELVRQRDNVLYANRQVSGVLAWIQRRGSQELLGRVDARTAKSFRVQKVYPFVVGRYLIHFSDGPEPDRRAAWGTWPQLLRLLDRQPLRAADANPIASLFNRLTKDVSPIQTTANGPSHEIALGDARLTVHASYAAFRASADAQRDERH